MALGGLHDVTDHRGVRRAGRGAPVTPRCHPVGIDITPGPDVRFRDRRRRTDARQCERLDALLRPALRWIARSDVKDRVRVHVGAGVDVSAVNVRISSTTASVTSKKFGMFTPNQIVASHGQNAVASFQYVPVGESGNAGFAVAEGDAFARARVGLHVAIEETGPLHPAPVSR